MLAVDALEVVIATDGAMGAERIIESHEARVITGLAGHAAPRVDAENPEGLVHQALAARATHLATFADWAIHRALSLENYNRPKHRPRRVCRQDPNVLRRRQVQWY